MTIDHKSPPKYDDLRDFGKHPLIGARVWHQQQEYILKYETFGNELLIYVEIN